MKSDSIKDLVRKFHQRLEEELKVNVEVFLYGSHARGENTEDSDVDVLVILPYRDAEVESVVGDIAWQIGFEAGVVISIVLVSQDELPILKASPFIQSVQREGIRL